MFLRVWNRCLLIALLKLNQVPYGCKDFCVQPGWELNLRPLRRYAHALATQPVYVLRECIWNAPAVSLVLLTFDDTGFLGSSPRQMIYPLGSMVPP